jgi:hypothetical protein
MRRFELDSIQLGLSQMATLASIQIERGLMAHGWRRDLCKSVAVMSEDAA